MLILIECLVSKYGKMGQRVNVRLSLNLVGNYDMKKISREECNLSLKKL